MSCFSLLYRWAFLPFLLVDGYCEAESCAPTSVALVGFVESMLWRDSSPPSVAEDDSFSPSSLAEGVLGWVEST
ncbi:hypothetical protein [Helicobacter sp. T3_23-1056]